MREVQLFSDFELELLRQVNEEKLMEFTKEITKEVRMSGSPEELRAFKYVENQIRSFGIETKMLFSENLISIPGKAELKVGDTQIECITHSMAKPVENLNAVIVDIGDGKLEDNNNKKIEGNVVLINGIATPDSVKKAESFGAVAAIFIHAEYTHEMIVSPVWGTPVPETVNDLPKIPVVSVNAENGRLINNLIAEGHNNCLITTEVDTSFKSIPTLIAEIKGTEEQEKFILLSGHIDSWHYGVMDNGTANAAMLEIIRILSKYRPYLKRTLRIAFWSGHSHGRYAGSTWYCDHHWEDLYENCILHINVDSLGAKGANVIINANCMKETRDLAAEIIYKLTGERFEGTRHGRSGDHSFWGTGTPSLFMGVSEQEPSNDPSAVAFAKMFNSSNSGGFGWWWHTTEDTIDKIDPKNLKRDCEIYLLVIFQALTEEIIPINQYEAVKDIEQALISWQTKVGSLFDLSEPIERAQRLKKIVKEFYNIITNNQKLEKDNIKLVNETIMELSRVLVPLNYVEGSVFEHDFALSQPAIPCLKGIDQLITVKENTNEFRYILNSLNRKRNRVNFELKRAIKVLESTLSKMN